MITTSLDQVWTTCQCLDCTKAREVLLRAVVGYSPIKGVEDRVRRQRNAGTRASLGSNVTPLEPPCAAALLKRPH